MGTDGRLEPFEVLRFLHEATRGGASAPKPGEIAVHFGAAPSAVRDALSGLRRQGFVGGGRALRLTDKAARRGEREARLREAMAPLLEEAVDLPTLFHVIQENLPHLFGMEQGCLWVKDPARRRFLGAYDLGLEPPRGFRDELPLKCQGLGEPLLVGDRTRQPDAAISSLFDPQVRSILILPVVEDHQFLGVMAFSSGSAQKGAEEDAVEDGRLAARWLATAVRRVETQFRFREDLNLHRSLIDLVRQMGGGVEMEPFLRRIFAVLGRLVPVDAMFVAVRRPDDIYDVILETDLDDSDRRVFFPAPRPMEMKRSMALESVVGHRYLLICRTPEELARISGRPASGDPWYPVGNPSRRSASLLFVPLWCGEDFKGVLSVQSYRMNAYRHSDAERVALVAEYVGLALRNARLAEEAARSRR
jgi:GAF domain-containing protein